MLRTSAGAEGRFLVKVRRGVRGPHSEILLLLTDKRRGKFSINLEL
jgi:hypothetical protein